MTSPNSDPDLKTLLTEWDLQQHYEHFIEQKINIKILRLLETRHIDRLLADLPIGDQAMFEHRLEIWKRTLLLEDFSSKKPAAIAAVAPIAAKRPRLSMNLSNDALPNQSLLEALECDDSDDSQIVETNDDAPQTFYISTPAPRTVAPTPRSIPTAVTPIIPRHIHTPSVPIAISSSTLVRDTMSILPSAYRQHIPYRYDLMKIITETSGGQLILNYYSKHQHLREEHRTALINVIARYIDANGCTLTLSESNQLESQIVELFPTEKAEFYRTARRGRIYNKIANMKRVYNKFNKEAEEPANIPVSQISSPASSSISISK